MRNTVSKNAISNKISNIRSDVINKYTARNDSADYNPEFRENWDFIQKKFRCCGFTTSQSVPPFVQHRDQFVNKCVPKACCIKEKYCKVPWDQEECEWAYAATRIYNEGCLDVLQRRFTKDLPDHLLFVSIGMAVTAIFGIVNVALAAAYVAQIMRKEKGFDFSQGVREDPPQNTMRMDSFN